MTLADRHDWPQELQHIYDSTLWQLAEDLGLTDHADNVQDIAVALLVKSRSPSRWDGSRSVFSTYVVLVGTSTLHNKREKRSRQIP